MWQLSKATTSILFKFLTETQLLLWQYNDQFLFKEDNTIYTVCLWSELKVAFL